MPSAAFPNPDRAEHIDPDLLDANESTWAFVEVDGVGCDENYEVRTFATLAS